MIPIRDADPAASTRITGLRRPQAEVDVKAEEIATSGLEVEFDPGTASDRAFRESAALVPGGDDAAVRSVDRAAAL